ncbi:S-layer homology domain-containing protein [Paenibacillus sinopodophylli]|uniref:S-layer homology domain-containing protein n=1 Tax=Paenibacillus sinopodophylli TaxID=1837342 RepID=UPI001FEB407F|nr:S-layer homology domain-containing protein [Paenibacillus sinopodophylli]
MKRYYSKWFMTAVIFIGLFTALHRVNAEAAQPFDDIADSYAKQEIIDLYQKKIITGTSKSSFSPTAPITRAEFITLLDRLLGLEPVASPVTPFADVAAKAGHYGWVQAAVQLGIADGVSETSFAPSKPVTRQEAAVWLTRALKKQPGIIGDEMNFGDYRLIASWASSSVTAVHSLGLMQGDSDGNFRPTDAITRQETAVMIHRVLQKKQWAAMLAAKPIETIKLGWQYGQSTTQFENNIMTSNVNTLSPRWFFAEASGEITDAADASLVAWARKHNKKVWPMFGNRSDQAATHKLLSSVSSRTSLIAKLSAYVVKYDVDGINLDFENVAPQDRAALTAFVTELAKKLKLMNVTLSMDVSPDRGTDWTDAFDFAALGKQVEYMVLMGYDEHWGAGSGAGPNASLDFVEVAISKLLKVVPNEKVILALPFYNRDWDLNKEGSVASTAFITLSEQHAILSKYAIKPKWAAQAGQYTAAYIKNGVRHQIWVEDGRSLTAKYKVAAEAGLAGLAYWYIGGESQDIWASMRNADRFLGYHFD